MDASIALALAAIALLLAAIVVLRGGGGGGAKAVDATATAPAPVEEPAAPNGPLQIFFGSQTGTAEGFAKTISDEAKRRGFAPSVVDLEDFDEDEFEDAEWLAPTVVFAMATYGEGEPTDNAHAFLKWAKAAIKEAETPFENTRFAVFGLGNRQYQHYNAMGALADDLLEKLGGARCCELGLGDDDADLEADFDAWREVLWAAVGGDEPAAGGAVETEFAVRKAGDAGFQQACDVARALPAAASTKFYAEHGAATVSAVRELRSGEDGGSTLHIELATPMPYATADNLAILARNSDDDVARVAKAFGVDPATRICLAPKTGAPKLPFPTPATLGTVLARYCDLTAPPKRAGLAALSSACGGPDLDDKDAFKAWLAAVPGPPTLASAVVALGDALAHDDALAVFLEKTAARLRPRDYTISSSAVADAGSVHVTLAVADIDAAQAGVCSAFLRDRAPVGATIDAFVRPSSFRVPASFAAPAPVVLVGPGTGVAPMRAILRERLAALNGAADAPWGPKRVSRATLYFGCKTRSQDHLYAAEMDAWVSGGALDAYHVAYSREQKRKVYVQDLLRRDADAAAVAADLVDGRGAVFVCGGTAMGASVAEAIKDVLAPKLGGADAAAKFVDAMVADGRYVQELWS